MLGLHGDAMRRELRFRWEMIAVEHRENLGTANS